MKKKASNKIRNFYDCRLKSGKIVISDKILKVKYIPHKIPNKGITISISNKSSVYNESNIEYIIDFDEENIFEETCGGINHFSSDTDNPILTICAVSGRYGEAQIFKITDQKKDSKIFFVNNLYRYEVIEDALKSKSKDYYSLIKITDNKLYVYYMGEMHKYLAETKNFNNLHIDEMTDAKEGIDITVNVDSKFNIQKIFQLADEKKAKELAIKPLESSIKYQHLEWKIKNNKISNFTLTGLDNDQVKIITSILKEDKVNYSIKDFGYIDDKKRNKPTKSGLIKNIDKYFRETIKKKKSLEIKIPNGTYALKSYYSDYEGSALYTPGDDPYKCCWLEKIKV